jgi:hypothetical protein
MCSALTDTQIALISNDVLQQFGNPVMKVTAEDVATSRKGGPAPPLALLTPCMLRYAS